MNWQHLTYFMTTAKLENFTKAARELYVTPSALNKAVRNLENEVGFPLFEKHGRNVRLTRYGKIFYDYVVMANDDLENGLESVRKELGLNTGRMRLAGIYTMCAEYLPPQIKIFRSRYPDVSICFDYAITSKILESVMASETDLGFCGDFDANDYPEIERKLLFHEDLLVIASKDHWLAGEKYVDIAKLNNETFIIYKNVNSGISYRFWPLFQNAGFTPHIGFEVSDDHSILGLVAAGLGIALVADNPAIAHEGIIKRRFKGRAPQCSQYMVWKKGGFLSQPALAFKDQILQK